MKTPIPPDKKELISNDHHTGVSGLNPTDNGAVNQFTSAIRSDLLASVGEKYETAQDIETRVNTFRSYLTLEYPTVDDVEALSRPLTDKKILDVGCGIGKALLPFGPSLMDYPNITGLDQSQRLLDHIAEKQKSRGKLSKLVQGDVQNLPFEDGDFDMILARHMLHHVPDIDKGLQEMKRVLRKDGILFVTTNSEESRPELDRLHQEVLAKFPDAKNVQRGASRFSSENGEGILRQHFSNIHVLPWKGVIKFPDVKSAMDYYTSKPYFKDAFDNEADKKKLYDEVAARIQSIIDNQGVFSVTHGGAIFIIRKDEEKATQKIESAKRFFGQDISYITDEATATEVGTTLQKNHIAKVVNFPPRAEALFEFAKQLGRPLPKYNQRKNGDFMDYIGDIRFHPNIDQNIDLPTEGSDHIGFHTAGSYNALRPGYFAMLMINPGWRGERLGGNGESLFVRWSDVIDEYQRRHPLSAAEDIECLMKTPVSYAPAFVKDDVALEPLLKGTSDKEFEVRYWDNILKTIETLIDKGLIPNGEHFYEILARFDQVVHSCPASIEHQMERSELIILDNRKVAHGRQSFIASEENPDASKAFNPRQLFTIHIAIK